MKRPTGSALYPVITTCFCWPFETSTSSCPKNSLDALIKYKLWWWAKENHSSDYRISANWAIVQHHFIKACGENPQFFNMSVLCLVMKSEQTGRAKEMEKLHTSLVGSLTHLILLFLTCWHFIKDRFQNIIKISLMDNGKLIYYLSRILIFNRTGVSLCLV